MRVDLRLENARVRTMDDRRPRASTIAVWHGRIVALDDDCAGIDAREIVDLGGRTVLPGFVDAHNHLAWAGQAKRSLDLSPATSVDAALTLIAEAAGRTPEDGWVDVVGYDQRLLGRHLTAADLDTVSAGRRVYVIHASGHGHLVNSAVLDGLADGDLHGAPGVVDDADGRPTGLFLEEATRFPNAVRTPYSVAELVDALATAGATCAAQGVTSVAEAGVGGGLVSRSPIEVLAYQQAVESRRFPLRVQLMLSLDLIGDVAAHADDDVYKAFPIGLRTGFGSGRLSIGATKTWLDGGMMARTAAVTEPYLDDGPPQSGALAAELDDLRARAIAAHAAGWQLALHAIGDRAIDVAIDIVETAQAGRPRPGARHRIEHCGLARPDQLPRLAAAGIVVVTQPTFLYANGDDYAAIMGPQRAGWLYRGQSYLDAGIPVAGSSDRPVADGAPLRAIRYLVDRTTRSGRLLAADERITVTDAVRMYTTGAAYACRTDHVVGSVTVGKYADLVVLDGDPWRVAPHEIADIPVRATVVGGELVSGDWPTS